MHILLSGLLLSSVAVCLSVSQSLVSFNTEQSATSRGQEYPYDLQPYFGENSIKRTKYKIPGEWSCLNNANQPAAASTTTEYDYKAFVRIKKNGVHECGGTLIAGDKILTAAHCFPIVSAYQNHEQFYNSCDRVFGYTARRSDIAADHEIIRVYWNSRYEKNSSAYLFDIAIAILKIPMSTVTMPCVHPGYFPAPSDTCFALGMGQTEIGGTSKKLKKMRVSVSRCTFEMKIQKYERYLTCTTSNPRRGDSGGPVLCHRRNGRPFFAGILSMNHASNSYTVVSNLMLGSEPGSWLLKHLHVSNQEDKAECKYKN